MRETKAILRHLERKLGESLSDLVSDKEVPIKQVLSVALRNVKSALDNSELKQSVQDAATRVSYNRQEETMQVDMSLRLNKPISAVTFEINQKELGMTDEQFERFMTGLKEEIDKLYED